MFILIRILIDDEYCTYFGMEKHFTPCEDGRQHNSFRIWILQVTEVETEERKIANCWDVILKPAHDCVENAADKIC